jgi:hypothetical protein
MLTVCDGTRQTFSSKLLVTVSNGQHQIVSRDFHPSGSILFTDLPTLGNLTDDYTFLASADDYKDAGFFPVRLGPGITQSVSLMLLPQSSSLNFAKATWKKLDARPSWKALLANGASSNDEAGRRYGDLEDTQDGAVLACMLNIFTAAQQVFLSTGTAFDYFKQIIWTLDGDSRMAQDRFFAWADPTILHELEAAKAQGQFVDAPYSLHPGATRSYKQVQFGEANLQLTFHENDKLSVNGLNCIKVEPDIDYYKDAASHLLLEVSLNTFGSLTDPRTVYALRWMAGRRAGIPEFDPLYTITRA